MVDFWPTRVSLLLLLHSIFQNPGRTATVKSRESPLFRKSEILHFKVRLLKVHNKQSTIYFLFFEIYNVNYKGEVGTRYLGFREKNNFYFPVSDEGSEKCH